MINEPVNPEQNIKALEPIVVTVLGMTIDAKCSQSLKALQPMAFNEVGSTTEVREGGPERVYSLKKAALGRVFSG